ncbi:MAG: DUF4199 domain-containing protein [Rikenellaceae bacterium]
MDNDIERIELAKFRFNSAAMAGLIIGAAVSLLVFATDLFKDNQVVVQILSFAEFIVVCWGLYRYTRQYVIKRQMHLVSFGHILSFQMLITLFASVLIGLSTYAVMFLVSPDFYLNMYKELFTSEIIGHEMSDNFSEVYAQLGSSPFTMVIYSVVGTLLKWFFPAMIISVILKRKKMLK